MGKVPGNAAWTSHSCHNHPLTAAAQELHKSQPAKSQPWEGKVLSKPTPSGELLAVDSCWEREPFFLGGAPPSRFPHVSANASYPCTYGQCKLDLVTKNSMKLGGGHFGGLWKNQRKKMGDMIIFNCIYVWNSKSERTILICKKEIHVLGKELF